MQIDVSKAACVRSFSHTIGRSPLRSAMARQMIESVLGMADKSGSWKERLALYSLFFLPAVIIMYITFDISR